MVLVRALAASLVAMPLGCGGSASCEDALHHTNGPTQDCQDICDACGSDCSHASLLTRPFCLWHYPQDGSLGICGAVSFTCNSSSATVDEARDNFRDHSLFIGPFYALATVQTNTEFDDFSKRFRDAYCSARHQGDRESYTTVFNTAVHHAPDNWPDVHYYTREEFDDGESFNTHLNNVADAFANAKGVSVSTGFFALGTERDLHTIRENANNNNMTTFVKDVHSFKKSQFKGDDYFSIDFFVDVQQDSLGAFRSAWRGARHAALAQDGVLAFAMGIHENEDGSYKAVCQETYASAAAYSDWLPIALPHVNAILDSGRVSQHPNPFTMAGSAEQLTSVKDTCDGLPFPCIQYTFDTCEGVPGVRDAVDVVV